MPPLRRAAVRAAIVSSTLAAFAAYYQHIYVLPKAEYNAVHPYTSWIPLTCWMVLRNMTPEVGVYALGPAPVWPGTQTGR
jgi:hypothetical protein